MKILIDQNISQRILPLLAPLFENLHHVRGIGLTDADDYQIFMFARRNGYNAVVTLDEDFVRLIRQFSEPPKIIWIRTGNIATDILSTVIKEKAETIKEFIKSTDFDIYEVFKP